MTTGERRVGQRQVLVLGVNRVTAVLAVPLGDGRRVLHFFDDLPEADAGVVRAERDFPELGAVRNDAHFGAAKVVVEEVLKPHAGHEQKAPLKLSSVALARADTAAARANLAQKTA